MGQVSMICPYDPTGNAPNSNIRKWYTIPVAKGTKGWGTGIYTSLSPGGPPVMALTLSDLLRDGAGQIIGVMEADLLVDTLSLYLAEELKIGKTGQTFIVQKSDGVLVGASAGGVASAAGGVATRWAAASSPNDVIQKSANLITTRNGNWQGVSKSEIVYADVFADVPMVTTKSVQSMLSSGHGLDWVAVACIPAADYLSFVWVGMVITGCTVGAMILTLVYDIGIGIALHGKSVQAGPQP
jgi:hypothetical protein